nr:replication factor C small subunit [Methanocaldococcus lauensis]
MVKINGVTKRTTFAELDKIYFKEEDEEYKDVNNLEVLTVDDNYKVRWAKVSKIIRHKVEKILKVYLEGGAVLELTGNHAIMMLSENGLITKKASDIKVGDFLLSFTANIEGDLENINSNISTLITKNKRISDIIYQMPIDKRIKYLKELFDCKGKLDIIKVPTISKDLSIDIVWLSRISGFESYMNKIILKNNLKKSDLLPANIIIKLLKKIEDKINGNWRYVLRHQLYEKKERVSKILIREILKMINKEELSEEELNIYYLLHKLAYTDLHALKVKKIEIIDYNDYVYDVSVPNNEMFFAGNVPILLHNSDERGIDVIRTKVKEFARTKPIGDIPFKIIFLDESDALTADAQNALRRIMEKYSNVCRFILSCNYPSKIIPPIQSRCAVFRFSPLKKEDIAKKLKEIAEKENLKLTESGLDAIIYVSEGDLRKAINVLQTAAALSNVIDDEIIYKVSSRARPEEVKKMMELALEGKFMEARDLLYKLMVEWGMSGEDILNQMFREINNLNIDERKKVELADYIGETDFRIVEGANERIQLSSLLAKMALLGKK